MQRAWLGSWTSFCILAIIACSDDEHDRRSDADAGDAAPLSDAAAPLDAHTAADATPPDAEARDGSRQGMDAAAPDARPDDDSGRTDGSTDGALQEGGSDGSPVVPDATSGELTENERVAIEAQTLYEIEQMGLIASTAKDSAMEHTIVIRLPFSWSFFTNDMLCVVDAMNPEGCRSGTSSFDPGIAFPAIAPAMTYEYEWAGAVGSYTGTLMFELEGVPGYFLDAVAFEPNDDALIEIRRHTEMVEVTAGTGEELVFARQAEKDFDIIRAGEPVRLHHTDTTTLVAIPLPSIGGVDVRSVAYEATFPDLSAGTVRVNVAVDAKGAATGSVTAGSRTLATVGGAPFADPPVPFEVDWTGEAAPYDGSGCTPECGDRICGREPTCGTDCGTCVPEDQCGPLGSCAPR